MDPILNLTATNLTTTNNLTDEDGGRKPGPLINLAVPLLMCSTGVLGNVLALTLLWRSRKENGRSVFYRLVAGLAATDLFGIMALSPVTIVTYSNDLKWVGGQPLCHYYSFMMIFAGLATVLLVLCMAVERCLAILSPYFYERHVTPERVKAVLASVWVVAALFSSLPLVSVGRNVRHYPGTWCFFDYLSERAVDKVFSVVYAVIGLAVIASTAVCNGAVMLVLLRMRRVSQNIGKSREGRTVTNMTSEMQMIFFLAGIILVFATCYCPLMVRVLINVSHTVPRNPEADLMAIRLASINQILDPWVYLLLRRRLAALLYSACRSVSPLHMSSLKTLKSEIFSNSPRNSPASKPRRPVLGRFAVSEKHGSDVSLVFKEDSSPPPPLRSKKHDEEYLPLKAESPEEVRPVGGVLALKGDSPEEKREERCGLVEQESPTSVYSSDKDSQASLMARSDCNGHCSLEMELGDRDALLGDCVDGPRSPTREAKPDQNRVLSVPPNSVITSEERKSEVVPVAHEEHLQKDVVKTSWTGEEIHHNCTVNDTGVDRNSKTSSSEIQEQHLSDFQGQSSCSSGTAKDLSLKLAVSTNDPKSERKDMAVSNGTLPSSAQNTNPETMSGSNSVMSSSASWPVVCRHGNQAVVKMEDGDHSQNGVVWNKRHSSVESSCKQCQQASQDLTYV